MDNLVAAVPLHNYSDEFYDYIEQGAKRSAQVVVRAVFDYLKPASVLDVGCGRGVWLREWMAVAPHCFGVDGAYVDTRNLAIPARNFAAHDLSQPLNLGRRFDLVQSLEVAEHIHRDCADTFVDNLCRHSETVLFSAAIPGQGGEGHINEQPLEYWRAKFRARGYAAYDLIRPRIDKPEVEPWYRYNVILYIEDRVRNALPDAVKATKLSDQPIPELAPLSWRLRCGALRPLPIAVVNYLAVLKHRLHNATR